MLKNIFITALLFTVVNLFGQISHGGEPLLDGDGVTSVNISPVYSPGAAEINIQKGKLPLRFATPIFTNLSPANSGVWHEDFEGFKSVLSLWIIPFLYLSLCNRLS